MVREILILSEDGNLDPRPDQAFGCWCVEPRSIRNDDPPSIAALGEGSLRRWRFVHRTDASLSDYVCTRDRRRLRAGVALAGDPVVVLNGRHAGSPPNPSCHHPTRVAALRNGPSSSEMVGPASIPPSHEVTSSAVWPQRGLKDRPSIPRIGEGLSRSPRAFGA